MKILIFGIPGSGKTYISHKLSQKLDLPIFHIDKHFFTKDWIEREKSHFLMDVQSVLKTDQWIIDGNGMRTLEMRFKEADIAIYCKLPRLLCLFRIFYRWLTTLGKTKPDGPEGAANSVTWRLIKYLWRYPHRYKEQIKALKEKYPHVKFLEVHSTKELNQILNRIQSHCP